MSRYFGRRADGEPRGGRAGLALLVAVTLALLAFWLADVRRYWGVAEPVQVERH